MSQNDPKKAVNPNLANYILFQLSWFAVVFFPIFRSLWGAVAFLVVFASIHYFFIFNNTKRDLSFCLIVAGVGVFIDTLSLQLSLFSFSDNSFYPLPPLWIFVLWVLFSSTLIYSLKWVFRNYAIAFLFGALGGPSTYYIGERLQLLKFSEPHWQSLFIYAWLWGVFMSFVKWVQLRSK